MSWQPIDTAPKDGGPVWAKGENYGDSINYGHHCCWAYWDGKYWRGAEIEQPILKYLTEWMTHDHRA